jgi:hypothetical protein
MPGVVNMYKRRSTPKRGEKRPLIKQTPDSNPKVQIKEEFVCDE